MMNLHLLKNNSARLAVSAALLLTALAGTVQAQTPKIALIDLKKTFEKYYKTIQADLQLKERATDSEKVLKGMVEDYQKASEEYKKIIDSANDQAVSADERDKRKKSAEAKVLEIQELEKNIQQFRRQTQGTLDEQKRRLRDQILKVIREEIDKQAKDGNFGLVLDTSAESMNQTPIIVYSANQTDLTDSVLKVLNQNAPPGVLDSAPAAAAEKEPAKAAPAGKTTPPARKN